MPPTFQQLTDYLRTHGHTDRTNPVTSVELAVQFYISDGGNEVLMRSIIRDAIEAGELIGSRSGRGGNGYYLIPDVQELDMVLRGLEHRAQMVLLRRSTLRNNWNRLNPLDQSTEVDRMII